MKPQLSDIDSTHLAFVTGHKLTRVRRIAAIYENGRWLMPYVAKLDGGPDERLAIIRKRLESEYLALEAKHGSPPR